MQQVYKPKCDPCRSVISIKLQTNFIEIALRHGCSPVNLRHIFRTHFPRNTSGWVLLEILMKLLKCTYKSFIHVNNYKTQLNNNFNSSSNNFKIIIHCVKIVCIRSYSCPHFPAFELNTERYSVSFYIQSEYRILRTRSTPNTDNFHAVINSDINCSNSKSCINNNIDATLHKKWSFLLRISLVNVTKSTGNCGFSHIYWKNP